MKKIAVLLIALMSFANSICISEDYDLTSFSDSELLNLVSKIQDEMYSRNNFADNVFWPGQYIVGVDIDEGYYSIECVELLDDNDHAVMYVYKNINEIDDSYNRDKMSDSLSFELNKPRKLRFIDSEFIEIKKGIVSIVKLNK